MALFPPTKSVFFLSYTCCSCYIHSNLFRVKVKFVTNLHYKYIQHVNMYCLLVCNMQCLFVRISNLIGKEFQLSTNEHNISSLAYKSFVLSVLCVNSIQQDQTRHLNPSILFLCITFNVTAQ